MLLIWRICNETVEKQTMVWFFSDVLLPMNFTVTISSHFNFYETKIQKYQLSFHMSVVELAPSVFVLIIGCWATVEE